MSQAEPEMQRIAEVAAAAARAVPGVIRLQPGLVGLVKQIAAQAWQRGTGKPVVDVAGVDVDLHPEGSVRIDVRVVSALNHHATDVGADVHTAITAAVEATTGEIPHVRVRIVEIDLEPHHL
ncbi:Asp23/Gls24 family envelope stress response protein [Kribbella sindirgiensis]|uniref:Asp23/Gls24 family envelope stress response protein n=1 Tax=Kribbella sindirgiensis TaxID=1124744 RepID=A0A4V2M3J2_9ACTN|nr:Asp23/Gls24 family envelope stress response protein [Kribbella sindirgiensis]TCC32152.1 Asp23/Gls24 family envelope stress response protein [Kribbella sindirgiensis]